MKMLEYTEVKISDLEFNKNNPRINDDAAERLTKGIEKYGFINPVVVNRQGNMILAGHTRVKALKKLGKKTVPVLFVDMDEATARGFAIWDNKSAEFSEWDKDLLDLEIQELVDLDFDIELTGFSLADMGLGEPEPGGNGDGVDDTYTRKIVAPIYEPKGEKPPISAMIDRDKTQKLIDEIEGAGLPDNVSEFLKHAAERHTVFHFRQIAEFYCHADKQVQELMEKSGMVIIDFDKAIEYGFVHMADRLIEFSETERAENEY